MQKILPLVILSFCLGNYSHASSAGDTVFNQLNEQGLKEGYWKKYYPNGNLQYIGYFENGNPESEMKRYYESGNLWAVMHYKNEGRYVKTRMYYETGELAAEGVYIDRKKDSTWRYYSFYTNTLVAEEIFNEGALNGIAKNYYENGKISEEVTWANNQKNGPWYKYFDTGKKELEATYENDKLNGTYIVYYPDGHMLVLGHFNHNEREGDWIYYDEDGNTKLQLKYENGKLLNEDELIEKDKEFFQMVEENLGKFEEPTPEDFMRGGGY